MLRCGGQVISGGNRTKQSGLDTATVVYVDHSGLPRISLLTGTSSYVLASNQP